MSTVAGTRRNPLYPLRHREFSGVLSAATLSYGGDQIARIALSVLVYKWTGSAATTALTYALSFAPAIVGGVLLGWIADRFPRRRVMVVCDLLQTCLVAAMVLPQTSIPLIVGLLVVSVLVSAPAKAAAMASIPILLPDEDYAAGMGLQSMAMQGAFLFGNLLGGALVGVVGARWGLLIDAGTFLASALIVLATVHNRPSPGAGTQRAARTRLGNGALSVIAFDPRLRLLTSMAWVAGLLVVPEGLAVPLAHQLGGGPAEVGALLLADPLGTIVGSYVYTQFLSDRDRARWMAPAVALSGVSLIAMPLAHTVWLAALLLGVSGVFSAYQIQAVTQFGRIVGDRWRGSAMSLAGSGLTAIQGLGVAVGGWVALYVSVPTTIALFGAAAIALGLMLWTSWRHVCLHGTDQTDGPARVVASTEKATTSVDTTTV